MKLLLIDGNSILNRAFYGIKTLTTKDGRYTNAIFGFFNIFLKQIAQHQPQYVAVAFDLPGGTFRNKMYDGYKANRKGMPEELAQQMPVVKELLTLMGYRIVTCQGFEADDILGTLSRAGAEQGVECYILTGDRDSLQLVDERVKVLYASAAMGRSETVVMDEAAVREKYGIAPAALIDAKALMGDSSDNVPGVKGIGEKTAMALISAYGDLDGVYANLDGSLVKPAMRRHLEEDRETAYLSKQLVIIDRHAPVEEALSLYSVGEMDGPAVASLLHSLEMHSLVDKLGLGEAQLSLLTADEEEAPLKSCCACSVDAILAAGEAALYFEQEGGVWYALSGEKSCALSAEGLRRLLASGCRIYAGDTKKLHRIALAAGIADFAPAFDYELAGYLLNPSASGYSAANLAAEYGVRAEYDTDPAELALVRPLCDKLQQELEKAGMLALLEDIEQPLSAVLAAMEHQGFLLDTEGIAQFGKELTEMAAAELAAVYDIAGHEFNLNSPKQLGTVLFEELGLPAGKKTRTGYSTDAETLDKLKDDYPIVAHVLRYRSYQKLNATYVEGLLAAAGDTGRIHTEFRQTETRTGRISSVNPNLQNIPIRTELGSRMRRYFMAAPGNVLLDADYSQIELRVLASMSGDTNMQTAFIEGHDVHTETASAVFRLPRHLVDGELRRRAKAVNFGIVYGIGAYSLSQDIGVTVKEAAEYIDSYLRSYPGISAYLDETVENAKRDGYVTTMYGRRRYIPELQNSNKQVQALGRRLAMNTPVQGSAADIIKIAMIRVFDRLRDELPQAKLILQVHDELIIECPEQDAQRASVILQQAMESAAQLAAPLIAEVHMGKNWYDAK